VAESRPGLHRGQLACEPRCLRRYAATGAGLWPTRAKTRPCDESWLRAWPLSRRRATGKSGDVEFLDGRAAQCRKLRRLPVARLFGVGRSTTPGRLTPLG